MIQWNIKGLCLTGSVACSLQYIKAWCFDGYVTSGYFVCGYVGDATRTNYVKTGYVTGGYVL